MVKRPLDCIRDRSERRIELREDGKRELSGLIEKMFVEKII